MMFAFEPTTHATLIYLLKQVICYFLFVVPCHALDIVGKPSMNKGASRWFLNV
jgi:hypothetical protein